MGRRALRSGEDPSGWTASALGSGHDRKHLADGTVEPAREVFLTACQNIASELSESGFGYSKSGGRCKRKCGDLSHIVAFQSSHYNASGLHVVLWLHARVGSRRLAAWRKEHASPRATGPYFAGGMVHLLTKDYAMLEWELADPADRAETIVDALEFTHGTVLPYLDRFNSEARVLELISVGEVLAFDMIDMVEIALCFGDRKLASTVFDRLLAAASDLRPAIMESAGRVGSTHDAGAARHAEQVAYLRRAHGLG